MGNIGKQFFSDQAELCKLYGLGLIIAEDATKITVKFKNDKIGIYTKEKHGPESIQ